MDGYDLDDPRPAYLRVAAAIRSQIERGDLSPGDQLLTHRALADQHGVAIETVKRALEVLRGSGLIVSRQGKGSYVSQQASDAPVALSADGELVQQVAALRAELKDVKLRLASLESQADSP